MALRWLNIVRHYCTKTFLITISVTFKLEPFQMQQFASQNGTAIIIHFQIHNLFTACYNQGLS